MTPFETRWMARWTRLVAAYPGRFCWVELVLAAYPPYRPRRRALHEAEATMPECRKDAAACGTCYCGAWRRDGRGWQQHPPEGPAPAEPLNG